VTERVADSSDDVQLLADLRRIGRLPRWFATVQLLLLEAVAIPAYLHFGSLWYLAVITFPVVVLVLALRVRARLRGDVLLVTGFLRNYAFPLDRVETFVRMPYQGIWSGGAPADWLGLWQIDVEAVHYSKSHSLPVTMCSRATATRLEGALNLRVDTREIAK
jgi:hypothetical protein